MERMHNNWIQTYTGRQFFPADPQPEDIDIIDISHALSNMCRFTGHTKDFYSVAEHCERASRLAKPGFEFAALIHDASEAYLVDVPAPIKPYLKGYKEIEERLQRVIELRFGLEPGILESPEVKRVDMIMLASEKRDLMGHPPTSWVKLPEPMQEIIVARTSVQANVAFLKRFLELGGKV